MSGEAGVRSGLGAGSTFWFTARLAPCATRVRRRRSPAAPADGRRVLVVDDNDTNRRVIGELLAGADYDIETAPSAIEALTVLQRAAEYGQPFQAVLTDHRMPGIDGLELARRIRDDPRDRGNAARALQLHRRQVEPQGTARARLRRAPLEADAPGGAARHDGARALARRARVHAAPARHRHARRDRRGPPAPRAHRAARRGQCDQPARRGALPRARGLRGRARGRRPRGARGAAQAARWTWC